MSMKELRHHQALFAGCLVGLISLFYVYQFLQLYHQDWTRFIQAGDRFFRPEEVPGVSILPDSMGYDGQFYYWVARDPFAVSTIAEKIDYTVRYSRIGYPLAGYLASLGNPERLPYILVFINVFALAVAAWALGRVFMHYGQCGLWGILVGVIPGVVFSLGRDLVEPLALCGIAFGILQYVRGRFWWSAVWFSLAVLTKETVFLGLLALAIFEIVRRRRLVLTSIIPVVAYLVWKIIVVWLFQGYGLRHVLFSDLSPVPFSDALTYYAQIFPPLHFDAAELLTTVYLPVLFLGMVILSVAVWRSRRQPLAWFSLGLALLVPFYSDHIWVEPFAYVRVSSEFWMGLIMLSALISARSRWLVGSGLLALSCLVAVSLF